jgi:hypothetical protein
MIGGRDRWYPNVLFNRPMIIDHRGDLPDIEKNRFFAECVRQVIEFLLYLSPCD